MRLVGTLVVAGAAMLCVACASSGTLTPAALARLERARAARPSDPAIARSLGIAYYKAGRYADARAQLDRAVRADPRDGTAALFLGLTAEQQKDIPAARAAYQSYVRYGRTSRVRRQLEARLVALNRLELQVQAKAAVAREQQLAAQPVSQKTVAVMPLRFTGSDTTLQPLERGMAELLTTDLSRSHELTIVERARLQALLDEIALQQAGATDSATNVRAGRIMQAGRIVSGQIAQDAKRLRVDAAIVNTQTASVTGGAANENSLDALFDIEKAIVLQLFDSLGVRLTTAERNAIEQRPTRSLQAFLAYSRGLRLEDQGKYDEAARSFQNAVRIDPSFGQAARKSTEAQAAATGVTITASAVEANLSGTAEGQAVTTATQGQTTTTTTSGTATSTADGVNPSTSSNTTNQATGGATTASKPPSNDPLSQATGGQSLSSNATVIVIVTLPKP